MSSELGRIAKSLTLLSHFPDPCQEAIDIVEQLRDYEVTAGVDLLFQGLKFSFFVCFFVRVAIRVG